jgi:hypothetical protein
MGTHRKKPSPKRKGRADHGTVFVRVALRRCGGALSAGVLVLYRNLEFSEGKLRRAHGVSLAGVPRAGSRRRVLNITPAKTFLSTRAKQTDQWAGRLCRPFVFLGADRSGRESGANAVEIDQGCS